MTNAERQEYVGPQRLTTTASRATRWRFTSRLLLAYLTTNRAQWLTIAVFSAFFACYIPALFILAGHSAAPGWAFAAGAVGGGVLPIIILGLTTYRQTRTYAAHPDKDAWYLETPTGGTAGCFTRRDKRRGARDGDVFGCSLFAWPTGQGLGRRLNEAVTSHVHATGGRVTGKATLGMKQTYLTTWDCYDDSDGHWWRSRRIATKNPAHR